MTTVSEGDRELLELAAKAPDCADKDEDCPGIEDKAKCWLYAPERGMCPYLRADGGNHG